METTKEYIQLLQIIKDVLVSLIWPLTILIIFLVYKSKIIRIIEILTERLKQTSKIELPGGITAFFVNSEKESISRVATQVFTEIEPNLNVHNEDVKSKIEKVLVKEKTNQAILYVISSQGMISRGRIAELLVSNKIMLSYDEIEDSIKLLIDNHLIVEEDGKLKATRKGVEIIRTIL